MFRRLLLGFLVPSSIIMAASASQYANWMDRCHSYSKAKDFAPTLTNLNLAVLRHGPANPQGFTLAIFSTTDPNTNVAVDALGHVKVMHKDDFQGISTLAQKASSLPKTGNWRNTWKIQQARTSQPVDRLFISAPGETDVKEVSVQGWENGRWALKESIGEYSELPESLREIVGLVREARKELEEEDVDDDQEDNEDLVEQVKALLGDRV
jgi:hypothetical protein